MESLASYSYQCTYVKENQCFTPSLIGNNGDIFQSYRGSAAAPQSGSIIPDWSGSNNKPLLRISIMDSDPNVEQSDIKAMISDANTKYFIDGTELLFGNDSLSLKNTALGIDAGLFKKITVASNTAAAPFGGLEIEDNLIVPFSGRNIEVSAAIALAVDGNAVSLQAHAPIRFAKRGAGDNLAYIYCDSSQSMVLDEDHLTVTLKARCWRSGEELASTEFTRKWFLLEGGEWVQKSTSDTYTLDRDAVPTFADVRVECWSKDATPALIATDTQTVADQSDSLIVVPNPSPSDGKIRQSDSNTGVTFDPVLTDIDGNAPASSSSLRYLFTVMNSTGMILNSASNAFDMASSTTQFAQSPATKFKVPREVFEAEGEGPLVNITCIKI